MFFISESFRSPIFQSGPDKHGFSLGKYNNFVEVFGDDKLKWFLPVFNRYDFLLLTFKFVLVFPWILISLNWFGIFFSHLIFDCCLKIESPKHPLSYAHHFKLLNNFWQKLWSVWSMIGCQSISVSHDYFQQIKHDTTWFYDVKFI